MLLYEEKRIESISIRPDIWCTNDTKARLNYDYGDEMMYFVASPYRTQLLPMLLYDYTHCHGYLYRVIPYHRSVQLMATIIVCTLEITRYKVHITNPGN